MINLSPACASLVHLVTCGFVLQAWTAAMLCAAHQLLLLLDRTGGGVQEPCPMLAHTSQTWWPQICLRWVNPAPQAGPVASPECSEKPTSHRAKGMALLFGATCPSQDIWLDATPCLSAPGRVWVLARPQVPPESTCRFQMHQVQPTQCGAYLRNS